MLRAPPKDPSDERFYGTEAYPMNIFKRIFSTDEAIKATIETVRDYT